MKKRIKQILTRSFSMNHFIKLRRMVESGGGVLQKAYEIVYKRYINRYGAFLPIDCIIGDNVIFPHGINGVFISSAARIGNGCVIFHQVTIGSNTLPDSKGKGAPIIGNNVYIGAGAKIIGNVKVGDNVRIGANCVVIQDIPDNTTVVLPKPNVIHHKEILDNSFIPIKKFEEEESAIKDLSE